MVVAESRMDNKMDGMHTAVDIEACAFGSTSGHGSGTVLWGAVSNSNDDVSPWPYGQLTSRRQIWQMPCHIYNIKPGNTCEAPLVFLGNTQ